MNNLQENFKMCPILKQQFWYMEWSFSLKFIFGVQVFNSMLKKGIRMYSSSKIWHLDSGI